MGVRIWGLKEPRKPGGHVQGVGDRHNFCCNSYTAIILNIEKKLLVYYVSMPVHKIYIFIHTCLYVYLEASCNYIIDNDISIHYSIFYIMITVPYRKEGGGVGWGGRCSLQPCTMD